ncbi:F-type H+-transporting ATPase subunit epsilon [[Clostridium] fimetarium]|uniref:ATP synthase epsilon chain n=2 Tax=[Clostridium] fimetarium TaxID=99656 RepID=A0A1I0R7H7_9FIRM|nr:F-type H+-transporting ATPase subunit epsilon [[Clostridium] fimetarium]
MYMNTFSLKVIASDKIFFDGRVEVLIIPEVDGEKAILAHHEDIVIAIDIGDLKFRLGDKTWVNAVVGKGFAQVINNRVSVLVDTAERPEDIDAARAKDALERAKEQLRQKQSLQDFHLSQASMARAMSRLKSTSKFD